MEIYFAGEEKSLYRECEGHFLSDPGSVRLYLPEIAEFFGKSLPLDAKMFLNCDVTDDSLSHLVSDVVTMTYVGMESSVVATSCWVDDQNSLSEIKDDDGQCLPVAIPTDLSIDVSVIESQPAKSEELYHTTRKLFENFQSARIKNMKQATYPSDPVQMLQHKLNRSIREGYEGQGVSIEKPTKVYKNSRKTSMHREGMMKLLLLRMTTLFAINFLCLRSPNSIKCHRLYYYYTYKLMLFTVNKLCYAP